MKKPTFKITTEYMVERKLKKGVTSMRGFCIALEYLGFTHVPLIYYASSISYDKPLLVRHRFYLVTITMHKLVFVLRKGEKEILRERYKDAIKLAKFFNTNGDWLE